MKKHILDMQRKDQSKGKGKSGFRVWHKKHNAPWEILLRFYSDSGRSSVQVKKCKVKHNSFRNNVAVADLILGRREGLDALRGFF